MQQGRTQLDADWDESTGTMSRHLETFTHDVVGKVRAPGNNFRLGKRLSGKTLRYDFSIRHGRYDVDGIPCENMDDVTFTNQPYPPLSQIPKHGGTYIAYLDAWERELTVPDDSNLSEVALTGLDTVGRSVTVWQVKILPLATKDGVPSPKRADGILKTRLSTVKPRLRFRNKPRDTTGTSTGTATWPQGGEKATLMPPDGILHHYAPLALLEFSSSGIPSIVRDYRRASKIH